MHRIDLFCRVIDHFGDAGVCLRLARQLAFEKGADVRLWIDDPAPLRALWPDMAAFDTDFLPSAPPLAAAGLRIGLWPDAFLFEPKDVADIVIEGFACELPVSLLDAMRRRTQPPVWINLEYLSAEEWVPRFHRGNARHPRLGLVRHFFFPGFTEGTGGLIREKKRRPDTHEADVAVQGFLEAFKIPNRPDERRISLFAYRLPSGRQWLDAMARLDFPVRLLVPDAPRLLEALGETLGFSYAPGTVQLHGRLCIQPLPFLAQDDYDRLLAACHLNFVRGEDSFVRAQWVACPLVWQIYRQPENAHFLKLAAFMDRHFAECEGGSSLPALWEAWNAQPHPDDGPLANLLPRVLTDLPAWTLHAKTRRDTLFKQDDLATNLLHFCQQQVQ
jgi:uncharacterized repeat protein (TIGR03837 family)